MHCVHCGRMIFRNPALHWGPKCAARAGLTAPPKRRILTLTAILSAKRRTKTTQRATAHDGQADWIDNLNTPHNPT